MQINYSLDDNAYEPLRAHEWDAGFDLRLPKGTCIYIPGQYSITIDTGVHFEIPEGYVGMIKSKSGLNVKDGITVEGVVDAGYTGSVVCKLYNHSYDLKYFNEGDKIAQIVFMPIPKVELNRVNEIAGGERGDNGFGSSGR